MAHRLKTIIALVILAIFTIAAQITLSADISLPHPASQTIEIPANPTQLPELPKLTQLPQTPLPQIETTLNLGVPAGNGATPRYLALNSEAGQVYILSEGIPILKQGNGLSVYDIKSGEIIEHIKINQGNNEPLDLQFDPETGLIYALWREWYGETPPTLTVIDSQSLVVRQDIPGIEAIAAGGDRHYAADAGQLVVFEVAGDKLVEGQRVELPPATTGPLAVSPATNRLYLARAIDGIWQIEIFEADALTPVGSYSTETSEPILNILPLPTAGEVLVVTAPGNFRMLYRLTTDGELADLPYELGPRFGAEGIALSPDGERLYFSNGQLHPIEPTSEETGPAFIGLSSGSDLSPLHDIPLLTNFDDLTIDAKSNQAFALYRYDHLLYVIDLDNEAVEMVKTAIDIRDVLVDEASNQIFVSDSANRVQRLDGDTFTVLAESQLEGSQENFGFIPTPWSGELALDRERNRLYVSGLPAAVLEADSLAEIATLTPGGQLAPDPGGDNVYMSNCGVTILEAETLSGDTLIPGSGRPRADQLVPNPCVNYSQLDPANQVLYSIVPNGTPGSNAGNYLYVYDLSPDPTLIFTDTDISIVQAEPEPAGGRAFVSYVRHDNRRLRTLDVPAVDSIRYTNQLMSLWGNIRHSPTTNRLYVSDPSHNRLLTMEADALSVIGETPLPPDYNYQLIALDPTTDRLYLTGLDGQLLIASPEASEGGGQAQAVGDLPPPPTYAANGNILALESTSNGDILARIEANYDDYQGPRLYLSSDEGRTWTDLSQNLPPFPIQALAASPEYAQDQTLFAGVTTLGQTGGLYQSTDGGQTWTTAMSGLRDLWVNNLFISPDFGQTGLIFANTTHAGLHQSLDGGQDWISLTTQDPNTPFPGSSRANTVAFGGDGVVLVSQGVELAEEQGIFRATLNSTGTLSEWQQVLDIPVTHLALSPDGRIALAFGNGLWRSTDGGLTWEAGGTGLTGLDNLQPERFLFAPTAANSGTVYFFFKDIVGSGPSRLFRSTDAGQSWQAWLEPPTSQNVTAITFTPSGDFLFGGPNAQVTRVAPSSLNWAEPETPATPFPVDNLAASPNYETDQTLFVISGERGLFKSSRGGQSWQPVDFPVRAYGFSFQPYQIAISPAYAQDQTLYITTGRSLHRTTDGGQSWEQLLLTGGKLSDQQLSFQAQQIALSPDFGRDQTLLASTPTAVYRSIDGGDSWEEVLPADGEASTSDILIFTPDGDTAYARFGYSHSLFVSTDGGQTWQMHPSNTGELFSVIAAATGSEGTLTVALEYDTRLLQTSPQEQPWRELAGSLPVELTSPRAVIYDPEGALLAGGQGGVFRTSDNGQSWQNLTNAEFPGETNVTGLYATDTHLFATLASGRIFTSADGGVSWVDISVVK